MSTLSSLDNAFPLVMGTARNLTASIDGGSRPNRLASGGIPSSQRSRNRWFDPTAFDSPAAFTFGNDSRTEPDLSPPGAINLSGMLQKQYDFGEKRFVEFRCQAGNALNHVNPGTPNPTIGATGVGTINAGGRTLRWR